METTTAPIKLTPEEMRAFTSTQEQIRALQDQTQAAVRILMADLTEKRRMLYEQHRAQWELVEKKYGLDKNKSYELVHSTGEVVEHKCEQPHGMMVVNLGDLMQRMASGETLQSADAEVKIDKTKLN